MNLFYFFILFYAIEEEPWTPLTNKVWHFDTEAIENSGDYVSIMKNLKRISGDQLNFENIKDDIDIENGKASISFDFQGEHFDWEMEVNDDWVDPGLFTKVSKLANKYITNGSLTYFDTGGQDVVLGWATEQELKQLKKNTGLNITWLN
jgi:hypothetical protein